MPGTTRRQPRMKNPAPAHQADAGPEPIPAPVVTTVGASLGIPGPGMRVIDLKISIAQAVRDRRQAAGLTPAAPADRLGVARPRVVELERGDAGVSLDAFFAAFFAVGAVGADLGPIGARLDAIAGA